jgi:hypothetical protein
MLFPFTVMMEALRFSQTSVLTRAKWRNIPEDTILHSHRRENLKSYKFSITASIACASCWPMMTNVEQAVKCTAGETEVLGETFP